MRVLAALVLATLLMITLSPSAADALASEESMLAQARQHLDSGNYSFAATWLQCLLRNYPATAHRQEAQQLLTRAAGSSGRSGKAVQSAAEPLKEFPAESAVLAPEVLTPAQFATQPEPASAAVHSPAQLPEPPQSAIITLPPVSAAATPDVQNALPAKAPEQKSVAGGEDSAYTLLTGETVNRKKLEPLLKKLKASGLQPVVRQGMKGRDVYRLVVECCSDSQAALEKKANVVRKVKDAFIVHEGDSYCLVAGSLLSAEAAERGRQQFADRGLPVTVVKTQVSLPVWRASVGNYTDAQEAAGAAKKLAALGIAATLVKIAD